MATFNEQANSILSQVLPILAADRTRRKDLEVRKESADYSNALAMNRLFAQAGVANKKDYVKRQDQAFQLKEQYTKAQIESSRSKGLSKVDIPSMIKYLEDEGTFNQLLNNSEFREWRKDPENWLDASENSSNMKRKAIYEGRLLQDINRYTGYAMEKFDVESLAKTALYDRWHPNSQFDENIEAVMAGVDPDIAMESLRYLKEGMR